MNELEACDEHWYGVSSNVCFSPRNNTTNPRTPNLCTPQDAAALMTLHSLHARTHHEVLPEGPCVSELMLIFIGQRLCGPPPQLPRAAFSQPLQALLQHLLQLIGRQHVFSPMHHRCDQRVGVRL